MKPAGNARTEMTRRPAVQIRPFRIFVIAELVDGEKYAAVSDSEVDCDLGNGVKSRELTSGDPCCRESPNHAYMSPRVTSSATGEALPALRRATRCIVPMGLEFGADCTKCKPAEMECR